MRISERQPRSPGFWSRVIDVDKKKIRCLILIKYMYIIYLIALSRGNN